MKLGIIVQNQEKLKFIVTYKIKVPKTEGKTCILYEFIPIYILLSDRSKVAEVLLVWNYLDIPTRLSQKQRL